MKEKNKSQDYYLGKAVGSTQILTMKAKRRKV